MTRNTTCDVTNLGIMVLKGKGTFEEGVAPPLQADQTQDIKIQGFLRTELSWLTGSCLLMTSIRVRYAHRMKKLSKE
jgi:hypothetical protein